MSNLKIKSILEAYINYQHQLYGIFFFPTDDPVVFKDDEYEYSFYELLAELLDEE